MPLSKLRERASRKVTPPSPTYMTNDQFAAFLANLRNNRVARPGGARPLPTHAQTQADSSRVRPARMSLDRADSISTVPFDNTAKHSRNASDTASSIHVAGSVSSRYSTISGRGRDYYPSQPAVPLKPSEVVPTDTYMERGQRWIEKEEAVSLRQAMHHMDLKDENEDTRIYQAALDEASELVWQHQNGHLPPGPDGPYRYRPHLRKNSYAHARTASIGRYGDEIEATGLARDTPRSVSGSSASSDGYSSQRSRHSIGSLHGQDVSDLLETTTEQPPSMPRRPPKGYKGIGSGPLPFFNGRRRSSMKRNISGEIERPFSGDQIWEEPESTPERRPGGSNSPSDSIDAAANGRSPLSGVSSAPQVQSMVPPPLKIRSIVDIHQNAPSQTRNPHYTTNALTSRPPAVQQVPNKSGMEIRNDEIRQATSMRMSQRSAKLPTPSAVSNSPGRPIVSFNPDWKPPEEPANCKPEPSAARSAAKAATIPTIVLPDDDRAGGANVPSIVLSDTPPTQPSIPSIDVEPPPSVPVIVTPDDGVSGGKPADGGKARPLPRPGAASRRSLPFQRPRQPPPMVGSRATASCHECGFPIEGRFVALAGTPERFHPQCFSCFSCGTSLEALEISPEPDAARGERLERIRRRAAGEILDEEPGKTMAEDGDERLRFYCHLDWHELFAPRCKHCKTPIIGEHVVALGEHWHYGHFFCAECGDPFEESMTHIEKDGYAWCINCQTKRTERRAPKCKKCKKAVIGQYVMALGGEWHDECFRCAYCNGGFEDGQIFPKEEAEGLVVLCTKCRARELKQ